MRGISEAGSSRKCLGGEGSVVKKKETALVYYFFQQNYYLQSERGLLQYIDLAKAINEASIPPPPPPPHRTPLRSY